MKKLIELEKHETNPFIVELKGKMYLQPKPNTIVAKGQAIVSTETGEIVEDAVLMGRRKIVDRTMFAKLYFSELATIYDLSKCAYQVLLYISKKMDFENKVIINTESACKEMNYKSYQSVAKGLRELADKNIIAVGHIMGVYWVNPLFVCKGERFAKYTEIITEEYANKQLKEQTQQKFDALDGQTSHSLEAMDQRAERAYYSNTPGRYEKEFPGMSGEEI